MSSHSAVSGNGMTGQIPAQYQKYINQWLAEKAALAVMYSQIQTLLKKMEEAVKHHKDVSMLLQKESYMFSEFEGDKTTSISDMDQLLTAMRNGLNDAQTDFNGIAGDTSTDGGNPTSGDVTEAQNMMNEINGLQAVLNYIKAYNKANPDHPMMDPTMVKNLQDAINNITGPFGSAWTNNDASAVAKDIQQWVNSANSGSVDGGYKTLVSAFQTLNQTVSALSTTTNTMLQSQVELVKQLLGIMEAVNQSIVKLTLTEVNNQKVS